MTFHGISQPLMVFHGVPAPGEEGDHHLPLQDGPDIAHLGRRQSFMTFHGISQPLMAFHGVPAPREEEDPHLPLRELLEGPEVARLQG